MNVKSFDPVSLDSIECRREWNSRIRNIRLFILSNLESFDPIKSFVGFDRMSRTKGMKLFFEIRGILGTVDN